MLSKLDKIKNKNSKQHDNFWIEEEINASKLRQKELKKIEDKNISKNQEEKAQIVQKEKV
jgi:hypothetical protein